MNLPTNTEIVAHVSEHFGLNKSQVRAILRVPTHPYTLRDEFAGKAMQGIIAHHDTWGLVQEEICEHAYWLADIMLETRHRGTE